VGPRGPWHILLKSDMNTRSNACRKQFSDSDCGIGPVPGSCPFHRRHRTYARLGVRVAVAAIDVQTGGTARPSPSPFEPGPFEPSPFEPGLLTGPGRAARRAASHVRARHYTGPSVPGRPGKPGPRMSPAQPEHAK
jgi:hypothetical protein